MASASKPQNIQQMRITRFVKPPTIMPKRAVFSSLAEPPEAMLCCRPRIWMKLVKVAAAIEYQVKLLEGVSESQKLKAGICACRPENHPTCFSPIGKRMMDMRRMRMP